LKGAEIFISPSSLAGLAGDFPQNPPLLPDGDGAARGGVCCGGGVYGGGPLAGDGPLPPAALAFSAGPVYVYICICVYMYTDIDVYIYTYVHAQI